MSSQWVNKYAIMRDLSMVQGGVPVDVAGLVEAGDKPPSLDIKEETEEEFFREWVGGDGDFSAPDLGLIKHMLEMVRNHDTPPADDIDDDKVVGDDPEHVIQIRKLNPLCSEFKPRALASGDSNEGTKQKKTNNLKKKKQRNAAVQSLLQNMEEDVNTEHKASVQLLKPVDFCTKNASNPHDKVTGWIKTQVAKVKTPSPVKKGPMLDIDPTSMFKKKKKSPDTTPAPVQEVKKISPYNHTKYVPSENYKEYYKKFLQCSEMHQMVQETVWTKVEKQMKDIDERRKAEAELFSLSLALGREQEDAALVAGAIPCPPADSHQQKLALVLLPRHRHQLGAPCAVCRHPRASQYLQVDDHCRYHQHTEIEDHQENVYDSWRTQNKTLSEEKNVDNHWRSRGNTEVEDQHGNDTRDWRSEKMELESESIEKVDKADSLCQSHDVNAIDESNKLVDKLKENVKDPWWSPDTTDELHKSEELFWTSADDADEIDAWKSEILGTDDDETLCKELVNSIEPSQLLQDSEASWQNEDHIDTLCAGFEKWRGVILGEDNIGAKIDEEMESVEKIPQIPHLNNNESINLCKSDIQLQIDKPKDEEVIDAEYEITKPQEAIEEAHFDLKSVCNKNDADFQFEITKTCGEKESKSNIPNENTKSTMTYRQFQINVWKKQLNTSVLNTQAHKNTACQFNYKGVEDKNNLGVDDDDDDDKKMSSWRQPLEYMDSLSNTDDEK